MAEITWRNQPVFISSTFRDMHEERNHLWHFVFPTLAVLLEQRRIHLEPIDLRWGIDSAIAEHAELKEKLILRACLSEINRSKPFIIVLLGQRYGWVPPKQIAENIYREMGMPDHDVEGKSVTHLEIDYGVLNAQDVTPFFYFEQDEQPSGDATERERANRLRCLINERFPERVRHYSRSNLTGLGELVRTDLENEFADAFPEEEVRVVSHKTDFERFEIERLVERRIKRAVMGRTASECLSTTGHWCSIVQGPPGSGRSTVFALTHKRISRDPDRLLLSHSFGNTATGGNADAMVTRWIEELRGKLEKLGNREQRVASDGGSPVDKLWSMVEEATRHWRVIILVDGVEFSEETALGRYLGWLNSAPIERVSIVLFDKSGTEREERLRKRFPVKNYQLDGLSESEARQLVDKVCETYHRTLPEEVAQLLISKEERSGGGRCSSNPLWLYLATEELNHIEASEFLSGDLNYPHLHPEERVLAMLRDCVIEMPDSLSSLYARKFRKLEEVLGRKLVRMAMGGVALSDVGLAEREVMEVVQKTVDRSFAVVDVVHLRMLLRGHLTQSLGGQWRFEHALARNALLDLMSQDELVEASEASLESRVGVANAYWRHFREVGDLVSEARFACVKRPVASMLKESFGELRDLNEKAEKLDSTYGFMPTWFTRGVGECFAELWEDCWQGDLEQMIDDRQEIDGVIRLLWNLSLDSSDTRQSWFPQLLNSIERYERVTRLMMHDFDGRGLWKTVFANVLRVCVAAQGEDWAEAVKIARSFFQNLNRHEVLDDHELMLLCFVSFAADQELPQINGRIDSHNVFAARSLFLAVRHFEGDNVHAELLEMAQKHPASTAHLIYDVLYLSKYSPEIDPNRLGFLIWQAQTQQRKFRRSCSQALRSLAWIESALDGRP